MSQIRLIPYESLLDGTIVEVGAKEYIYHLINKQKPFILFTEQSIRTRQQLVDTLVDYDFPQIPKENIFTSTMAALIWLQNKNTNHRIYYFGGNGLKMDMEEYGFEMDYRNPSAVLIGMSRSSTIRDYNEALSFLCNGALLINTDGRLTQSFDGELSIGNGSIVKMLESASNTKAFQFGRSNEIFYSMMLDYLETDISNVRLISDDFDNDILPAIHLGIDTTFLTKGVDIYQFGIRDSLHPTEIAEDFRGLIR